MAGIPDGRAVVELNLQSERIIISHAAESGVMEEYGLILLYNSSYTQGMWDPSWRGRLRLGLSGGLPTIGCNVNGEFPEVCWILQGLQCVWTWQFTTGQSRRKEIEHSIHVESRSSRKYNGFNGIVTNTIGSTIVVVPA